MAFPEIRNGLLPHVNLILGNTNEKVYVHHPAVGKGTIFVPSVLCSGSASLLTLVSDNVRLCPKICIS